MEIYTMSDVRKNFISHHLRSQIDVLRALVDKMDRELDLSDENTNKSLKQVETVLKRIRKISQNN